MDGANVRNLKLLRGVAIVRTTLISEGPSLPRRHVGAVGLGIKGNTGFYEKT